MNPPQTIKPKHREAILQSLRAGVVPRVGQQHIQVGRHDEVKALVSDVDRIADGGASIRFVIGEYGSGKTFFLNLIRSIALERNLVALNADLSPDRRLHATGGQARSLYAEMMRNIATRSKPDGGAMASVVEKFVSSALAEARGASIAVEEVIRKRLASLQELVGGYDFAQVIEAYWRGHDSGNEELKEAALRWLRGEYATKSDARAHLGVRTIVGDANVYDQLKLFARFVRLAGYAGVLIVLDELVNLYKLANTQSRNSNYEQILRILNDVLQGSAEGLGVLLGGTPEFLLDTRRGLYSYSALQSRLAQNQFATNGLVDYSGPVLSLSQLTKEDLYVLLANIRNVYASGDPAKYLVPDGALEAFMHHCSARIGDAYFRTPRNTVTAFVSLLSVLEQNAGANWQELLGAVSIAADRSPDLDGEIEDDPPPVAATAAADADHDEDDLASFRI
ncbi:MAG TPA: ATP-binding protein [Thermoanaerobaculia bacterium]|nr:ATP-binding protein [Thermoanaerobaculia bacterium]